MLRVNDRLVRLVGEVERLDQAWAVAESDVHIDIYIGFAFNELLLARINCSNIIIIIDHLFDFNVAVSWTFNFF